MADELDPRLEARLRSVLRAEAEGLPLTLRADDLERMARERRARRPQAARLLGAAAVLAVAVGVGFALGNGFRDAAVVPLGSPSPSAPESSASPGPASPGPTVVSLRTFQWSRYWDGGEIGCDAVGVDDPVFGYLDGADDDPLGDVAWLRAPDGRRLSILWPEGFKAAFSSRLAWRVELRDETGALFAHGGDSVQLQVSRGDAAGTPNDPYVAAGILVAGTFAPNDLSAAGIQATGCYPKLPDVGPAEFWVDPAELPLRPDTTVVTGFILERACASGQSPEGRVQEPVIDRRPDAVVVTFSVVHRPGGQDCPGNPPFPVVVDLGEPLGDRTLLDGSVTPPRDATVPPDGIVVPEPSIPPEIQLGTLLGRDVGGERVVEITSAVPGDTAELWLLIACVGTGSFRVDLDGITTDWRCTASSGNVFAPPLGGTTRLRVEADGDQRHVIELRARPTGGPGVPFVPPTATLAGPSGAVPGYAGCGLTYQLPDGGWAGDVCGPSWMPIAEDRALRVREGATLTLSLPSGWAFERASGRSVEHAAIQPAGRAVEGSALNVEAAGVRVTFTAPPRGDWGIQLFIGARHEDGTAFGVPYYFRVVVEP